MFLGPERAETLTSAIPVHDFDEVATKADLAILRAELMGEMSGLRVGLETDIANLRAEITSEIAALRKQMNDWMLTLLVTMVGAMAGIGFIS